nr:unnamed protein product [Trichobilharzia regenti]
MLSYVSKLSFIILVSLCIVNILKIESARYMLPMKIDDKGRMFVNFHGTHYALRNYFVLIVQEPDCVREISLRRPTDEELAARKGFRQGFLHCESWYKNNSKPSSQNQANVYGTRMK